MVCYSLALSNIIPVIVIMEVSRDECKLIFAVFAACIACVASHSESGCTKTDLELKSKKCEDDFFKAMIKGGECSSLYGNMVTCMKDLAVSCYPNLPESTTRILVDSSMNLLKAQQFYCSNGSLHINITAVPETMKTAVACKDEYFSEHASCANDFRKIFTDDAKNHKLCGLYPEVQKCSSLASKDYCSKETAPDSGKTNVFCQTSTATTVQPLIFLFFTVLLLHGTAR